jgi:hypothetical protein
LDGQKDGVHVLFSQQVVYDGILMLKTRANQSNVEYYYCTVHPLTPYFAVSAAAAAASAAASAAFLYNNNNTDHNLHLSSTATND